MKRLLTDIFQKEIMSLTDGAFSVPQTHVILCLQGDNSSNKTRVKGLYPHPSY